MIVVEAEVVQGGGESAAGPGGWQVLARRRPRRGAFPRDAARAAAAPPGPEGQPLSLGRPLPRDAAPLDAAPTAKITAEKPVDGTANSL